MDKNSFDERVSKSLKYYFLFRWRSTSHPFLQSGVLTVCNAPSRSSEVRAPCPTLVRSPAICPNLHLYHRHLRTKVRPLIINPLSFNTFSFKANCITSGQIGEAGWDQKVINYRFVREFSPLNYNRNVRVMLVFYALYFITHMFVLKWLMWKAVVEMGPLLSEIAAAGRCKVGCNIIPAGNCEPSYCVPLECLFLTLIVKVSIPTETFLL